MSDEAQIRDLDAQQLREVVRTLIEQADAKDCEIAFNALMKRLDKAIGLAWSDDLITDEVNGP